MSGHVNWYISVGQNCWHNINILKFKSQLVYNSKAEHKVLSVNDFAILGGYHLFDKRIIYFLLNNIIYYKYLQAGNFSVDIWLTGSEGGAWAWLLWLQGVQADMWKHWLPDDA